MDKLSSWILLEILSYLDFTELIAFALINKKFKGLVSNDYKCIERFSKHSQSTFHSGPYFSFPTLKSSIDHLDLSSEPNLSFLLLPFYLSVCKNPISLNITPVQASSEDYTQVISCTLKYDDGQFWSSTQKETPDNNEFLIYSLDSESFVYCVSFKSYRALYQGGPVYPPKKVKVSIGQTKDEFHYESDEFEVEMSEQYNTVAIYPKLVRGKFVRLDLIGMQMREPGSEKFYTVLSFVEVVGHPVDKTGLKDEYIENIINRKNIEEIVRNQEKIRKPSHYERLINAGVLADFLKKTEDSISLELKTFLYFTYGRDMTVNYDKMYRPGEIFGNHLFKNGNYMSAMRSYKACNDLWGYCRSLFMLENYELVKSTINAGNPRAPNLNYMLKFAERLGPEYLAKAKANLMESE